MDNILNDIASKPGFPESQVNNEFEHEEGTQMVGRQYEENGFFFFFRDQLEQDYRINCKKTFTAFQFKIMSSCQRLEKRV